ncbi:MAG: hypothetical protein NTW06_03980 [Candidatus Falkowbacteria bacterium]|nr:hypothetical protein [Candidatus Falkowbacteria bacterium]
MYISTVLPLGLTKYIMEEGRERSELNLKIKIVKRNQSAPEDLMMNSANISEFRDFFVRKIELCSEMVFLIPKELRGCWFSMIAEERTDKDERYCQVICKWNGDPLKPFYIPSDPIEKGFEALFRSQNSVVTILADKHGRMIVKNELIQPSIIEKSSDYAVIIRREVIWVGGYGEKLPTNLENFSQADAGAIIKAGCENCTHCHYCVEWSLKT